MRAVLYCCIALAVGCGAAAAWNNVPPTDALGYSQIGTIVTVRGVMQSVDADTSSVWLASPYGLVTVAVPSYADVRSFGRPCSLLGLRTGTYAVVTGRLDRLMAVTAHTINIGGPDPAAQPGPATLVSGTIIREMDLMSRSLTLSTPIGQKLVQVAPGGRVSRRGYLISGYDLRYGDQVQAVGYWTAGVYVATQLDVLRDGPRPQWVECGRVISIDLVRKNLELDIGPKEVLVGAGSAEIWRGSDRRSFSDLMTGAYVTVYGNSSAGRVDATRIEIAVSTRRSLLPATTMTGESAK